MMLCRMLATQLTQHGIGPGMLHLWWTEDKRRLKKERARFQFSQKIENPEDELEDRVVRRPTTAGLLLGPVVAFDAMANRVIRWQMIVGKFHHTNYPDGRLAAFNHVGPGPIFLKEDDQVLDLKSQVDRGDSRCRPPYLVIWESFHASAPGEDQQRDTWNSSIIRLQFGSDCNLCKKAGQLKIKSGFTKMCTLCYWLIRRAPKDECNDDAHREARENFGIPCAIGCAGCSRMRAKALGWTSKADADEDE